SAAALPPAERPLTLAWPPASSPPSLPPSSAPPAVMNVSAPLVTAGDLPEQSAERGICQSGSACTRCTTCSDRCTTCSDRCMTCSDRCTTCSDRCTTCSGLDPSGAGLWMAPVRFRQFRGHAAGPLCYFPVDMTNDDIEDINRICLELTHLRTKLAAYSLTPGERKRRGGFLFSRAPKFV